jgi:hypothetical protein
MRIDVTAEHIRRGRRNDANECPVAIACHEAGLLHSSVGAQMLWLYDEDGTPAGWTPLPQCARDFIRAFDESRASAQPFGFEVDLP